MQPKGKFIQLRDVLKWIPTLNRHALYKFEEAGLLKPFRAGARGWRWYSAKQIRHLGKINVAGKDGKE